MHVHVPKRKRRVCKFEIETSKRSNRRAWPGDIASKKVIHMLADHKLQIWQLTTRPLLNTIVESSASHEKRGGLGTSRSQTPSFLVHNTPCGVESGDMFNVIRVSYAEIT